MQHDKLLKVEQVQEDTRYDTGKGRGRSKVLTIWSSITHHQVSRLPLEVTYDLLSC